MELEIGFVIAGIDLVIGLAIFILAGVSAKRLKGGTLYWSAAFFFLTGVIFVIRAAIEVLELGSLLYAISALLMTLLLAFTMVIIDITTKMLGVRS
ncbi:MAG: hypothetical protein OIN66_11055 [Candidatus Methanoperedens sp.]|nr:hypothetical protein [Candidatus Methanoperedens sp.]